MSERTQSEPTNAIGRSPTARVMSVNPKSGPYVSIADAVTHARAGDVVQLAPGVYDESVVLAKPITLQGEAGARDSTVIVGRGSIAVRVFAGNSTVRRLTVRAPEPAESVLALDPRAGAIYVDADEPCLLEDLTVFAGTQAGVWLLGSRHVLKRSIVRVNGGTGIFRDSGSRMRAVSVEGRGSHGIAYRHDRTPYFFIAVGRSALVVCLDSRGYATTIGGAQLPSASLKGEWFEYGDLEPYLSSSRLVLRLSDVPEDGRPRRREYPEVLRSIGHAHNEPPGWATRMTSLIDALKASQSDTTVGDGDVAAGGMGRSASSKLISVAVRGRFSVGIQLANERVRCLEVSGCETGVNISGAAIVSRAKVFGCEYGIAAVPNQDGPISLERCEITENAIDIWDSSEMGTPSWYVVSSSAGTRASR